MTNVAKILKTNRIKMNLTQRELADLFDVHFQFISNIERGRAPLPLSYVDKLIVKLKIDKNNLYDAISKDYLDRHK